MGKGRDNSSKEAAEHQSAPLSTLKDPSLFPPPPKHVHYHGAGAAPDRTTPDTAGWGAPLSQNQVHATQAAQAAHEVEETQPKPPPVPYRVDTSGLSTTNLPKPPVRHADGTQSPASSTAPIPSSKPRLPPRLPPRQNSHPDLHDPPPPPSYNDAVKQPAAPQGALDRLGQAGVSVPGFNIHRTPTSPPIPRRSPESPLAPEPLRQTGHGGQLSELQQRFAGLSKPSSSTEQPEKTTTGTTWAQKQAALKTASQFRNDPSSVSLSDARSAASTANNFRERHGEQVASGMRTASGLNQRYGVMNKVSSFTSGSEAPSGDQPATPASPSASAIANKKPPPPVPKKKEFPPGGGEPPPVPLSSKPRPQ
jgi:hypothetical protein